MPNTTIPTLSNSSLREALAAIGARVLIVGSCGVLGAAVIIGVGRTKVSVSYVGQNGTYDYPSSMARLVTDEDDHTAWVAALDPQA